MTSRIISGGRTAEDVIRAHLEGLAREEAEKELKAKKKEIEVDRKPAEVKSVTTIKADNAYNPADYIILPGKVHGSYSYPDLVVSMDRYYHGKNWDQAHEELNKEGYHMQNPRQFVDFLNLLRSGNVNDGLGKALSSDRIEVIYKEITEVREPWRAEWHDAKFFKRDEDWFIIYHKIKSDGTLEEVTESLEECLMEDKTPGISLDYWLANATQQGLPFKKTKKGGLYYWNPRDGSVARFGAGSDRVVFYCDWDPLYSDGGLGVRRQKIFP